jgi:hypothetical protein
MNVVAGQATDSKAGRSQYAIQQSRPSAFPPANQGTERQLRPLSQLSA